MVKRTLYFVDRTFQQRVAVNLMLIALFLPIILLINFYIVGMFALSQNPGSPDLPQDWGLVGQMLRNQWWLILLFVAASLAFSFGLILYYTHHIAGPVYRFRRLFDDLAEGKVGAPVQLRKGDCFENLAASVTRANATLASSIQELKNTAKLMQQKSDALQDPELKASVAALNRVLARFQISTGPALESAASEN